MLALRKNVNDNICIKQLRTSFTSYVISSLNINSTVNYRILCKLASLLFISSCEDSSPFFIPQ